MTATDVANEVQAQLLTAVSVVHEGVITTIEWVTDQAEIILPDAAVNLASRLPDATPYIERGFDVAEQWLRTPHDFAGKLADVLRTATPAAPEAPTA